LKFFRKIEIVIKGIHWMQQLIRTARYTCPSTLFELQATVGICVGRISSYIHRLPVPDMTAGCLTEVGANNYSR
jgi:hypothetical protein